MQRLYESNGTTFSFYYCCNTQQINCALITESTILYLFISTTVGTLRWDIPIVLVKSQNYTADA
jgi:hypothetical protein